MFKDKGFLRWDPGQPFIPKGMRIEVSQLASCFPLPHSLEVGLGDSFSSMRCVVDYTEYPELSLLIAEHNTKPVGSVLSSFFGTFREGWSVAAVLRAQRGNTVTLP